VAESAIKFVKEKRITQIVFGHSTSPGWRKFLYLSDVHRFLRDAPSVDIHIVTQEGGLEP
jgi:two-component system sensor histidine kinase KdpD